MSRPLWPRRAAKILVAQLFALVLYAGFFAFGVSPASPTDTCTFTLKVRAHKSPPSIDEVVYINGKAFLAIGTIGTIGAPSDAYSMAFERLDGHAE